MLKCRECGWEMTVKYPTWIDPFCQCSNTTCSERSYLYRRSSLVKKGKSNETRSKK